jgi:hypothetical protein
MRVRVCVCMYVASEQERLMCTCVVCNALQPTLDHSLVHSRFRKHIKQPILSRLAFDDMMRRVVRGVLVIFTVAWVALHLGLGRERTEPPRATCGWGAGWVGGGRRGRSRCLCWRAQRLLHRRLRCAAKTKK